MNPVAPHAYVINVAAFQNGIGYKQWHHIDGWSEAVLEYIRTLETNSGAYPHLTESVS